MFSACDAQVGLGVALGRSGSNSAGLRALKEYRRVHADDVNEDAVVAHMEMGAIIFKQVSLEALQTYCSCRLAKPPTEHAHAGELCGGCQPLPWRSPLAGHFAPKGWLRCASNTLNATKAV